MIDQMLKVNPNERLDISQVVSLCDIQMEQIQKKPKIDPFLIMDDIIEKLRLLDYENQFCKRYQRNQISRIFFSQEEDPDENKFSYFCELAYWLMSFSKDSKRLLGGVHEISSKSLSKAQNAERVLSDLRTFGVNLSDSVNAKLIQNVRHYIYI